ncbi:MAG TPA: histidinol-phosphate transaminase [Nitrosopumilaceae archaeon]|nr:histidinol-phosphate transaminase [Nitrosopumilaceae archaeon]
MKSGWFQKKVEQLSKLKGYQKPEKFPNALKLDSNENYAIDREFSLDLIKQTEDKLDVREYPLSDTERLVESLSKYTKIPQEMIGVGNGSDQIIDLILANFASKETKILTSEPTFGFFEERCKLYSIPMIKIPFTKNMTLELEKFLSNIKKADILYLDSPNNPTGFQFTKNKLEQLIKEFDGLVIIDEAYVEFADYSIIDMTKKKDNLIVLRTLSKSFGLAGLRVGYFVANKKIASVFTKTIQYPYPLNTVAIETAILALQRSKQISEIANLIKNERSRMIETLRSMGVFQVFDSKANFVLFSAPGSGLRIYKALVEQGIVVKNLGKMGSHDGCLRVTVGSEEMNSKFLLAMRDLLR